MQRELSVTLDHSRPRLVARRLVALAGVLAIAGCVALLVDLPVAQWLNPPILDTKAAPAKPLPGVLVKLCDLAEVFAHAIGVGLIVLTIVVLDPAARRSVPRILTASLGAGLLADSLKIFIARWRPRAFGFSRGVMGTFIEWLPLLHNTSAQQGFPSSHAAVAAGLAVALSWLYPRGGWWFSALAVLACCQRLVEGAHFPSDVLWGAAIGVLVATACVHAGAIARTFDRFEQWLSRHHTAQAAGPRHLP